MGEPLRTNESDEHTNFEDLVGGSVNTLALKNSDESPPLSSVDKTKDSSFLRSEDVRAPATSRKSRLRFLRAVFTRQRS